MPSDEYFVGGEHFDQYRNGPGKSRLFFSMGITDLLCGCTFRAGLKAGSTFCESSGSATTLIKIHKGTGLISLNGQTLAYRKGSQFNIPDNTTYKFVLVRSDTVYTHHLPDTWPMPF